MYYPFILFNYPSIHFARRKPAPKLYIQGDLHGSVSWKRFHQAYKQDRYPNKYFIFLGDVSDPEHPNWKLLPKEAEDTYRMEGELSKLDDIIRAIKSDKNTYFILGNHEAMRLAPFVQRLDPELTFFTRKVNDYRQYISTAPDVAFLWTQTAAKIRELVDKCRGKVFIAKTFGDNVILSHAGFANPRLLQMADPDVPLTSQKLINNLDRYFAAYKASNKCPMSEVTLPGTIQIFGHFAGVREFPTIVHGPMGGKSYCVDDSIQNPMPEKRGLIYYVGDDVFEVFR